MKKVELLAPAGNLEKLKYAFSFGADAVYLAGKAYGMRSGSDNFTISEMEEGINFAHQQNKKAYVTANIFAHNKDLENLAEYINQICQLKIDAVIVADYGIFRMFKKENPNLNIHISTQANVTNYEAALFWQDMGAKRITLARELSLKEIEKIRSKVNLELEIFAHGAMCMAYSGRCLLSNYLTGRDSNQGSCAHVCRWEFNVQESKTGEHKMILQEDERGAYIFNSKDMATIPILENIVDVGIDSIKIEGRMKSINYVSQVTKIYREALDCINTKGGLTDQQKQKYMDDLKNPSNRDFFTGFYEKEEKPVDFKAHNYETSNYNSDSLMIGTVKEVKRSQKIAIDVRHELRINEPLTVITPKGENFKVSIPLMNDITGNKIEKANPNQIVLIPYSKEFKINSIIIKKKQNHIKKNNLE